MKKHLYLIIFCLLYIIIGTVTVNNIFIPAGNYFSLWLAGGFGFVMLFLYEKKAIPFLIAANVLVQLSQFYFTSSIIPNVLISITIFVTSLIKVSQAIIAWWLWQNLEIRLRRRLFTQGHDILLFLIIVAIIPAVLTSWAYVLINEITFSNLIKNGLWFIGYRLLLADILGLFLFAPLVYSFKVLKKIKLKDILIMVLCYMIPFATSNIISNNFLFMILTPVAIISVYYVDVRKLIPFHTAVLIIVMWLTKNNLTIFSNEMHDDGYEFFMLFAFVATITIYFIGITMSELNEHKNNLEQKITRRTSDLENEINERRKAVIELKKKDLLVNTILSSSPIGITLVRNRKIIWVNEGASQILGYNSKEIMNQGTRRFYVDEVEYNKVGTHMYDDLKIKGFGTIETKLCTSSGSVVDVLIQAKPLNMANFDDGSIFTFVDITSLKTAQNDLEKYTSKLEETNKELDAFAHSVAHDLKNPLNAVMGFSELLIEDYDLFDREDSINFLKRINMQADKMLQIIDGLLLLSGVRKEHVEFEALNMNDVVNKSVQGLEELGAKYNANINIDRELPDLVSQQQWLEVVWVNLISNAIKYGGDSPEIRIGYKETDAYHIFWVDDKGPGIPADKQAGLFMEFVRIKYDKNGHGLGLSIVKRIVERLNGKVFVKSEEGKGSRFGFKLPKIKEPVSPLVA